MNISSITGGPIGDGRPHAADTPERIRDAASQFEALLIGQVLKAAHQDGDEGWLGSGENPAGASAMDFANDYFARALAAQGGLGLTNMVVSGVERDSSKRSNRATPPEPPGSTPTNGR